MPDPVKVCEVYKEQGCSHVDGFMCEPNTCSMRISHRPFAVQIDNSLLDLAKKIYEWDRDKNGKSSGEK